MPKEAMALEAADYVLPLSKICRVSLELAASLAAGLRDSRPGWETA